MTRERPRSIAVLMTCHNRREKTVACVTALGVATATLPDRYVTHLYLTDDGSSDGTADAVRAVDPGARIIQGSGQLFWNGGMRIAFGQALADGHDFYLWLNDDTILIEDGLARLLETWERQAEANPASIVVGSTHDGNGRLSYGGAGRPVRWKRTSFARRLPGDTAVAVETFNGNCVLIPAAAAARLGNLDGAFIHGIGDFDYGLRATALGIPIWVMPGFVGVCANNDIAGSHRDRGLSLAKRWRKATSVKELPPASWAVFCRRHAGFAWPLYWAFPYAKVVATALRDRLR